MKMCGLAKGKTSAIVAICLGLVQVAAACAFARPVESIPAPAIPPTATHPTPTASNRPVYNPGELVSYTAQSGDNLPMLAARFNTTEAAIREANPIIPPVVSTLPQGLPMQIPIYYLPFWGSAYKLIPNSAFVYSSCSETMQFEALTAGNNEINGDLQPFSIFEIDMQNFRLTCLQASIDPRLVLSIIAYGLQPISGLQSASQILTDQISLNDFSLLQHWLGILNEGYYSFEAGELVTLELPDGSIERLDPWQNAGSAALRYFFSQMLKTPEDYRRAVDPGGFTSTYMDLFGDPWSDGLEVLPGSLEWIAAGLPINPQGGWQAATLPEFIQKNMPWSGAAAGFHASMQDASDKDAYGKVFASISGNISRMDTLQLVISQFGMPETQGWSIVYFGLAVKPGLKVGDVVQIGEYVGRVDAGEWNASFWLARKFNGEWVPAGAVVPFTLGDWILAQDVDGQNLVMHKPELTVYSQPYKGQTNP